MKVWNFKEQEIEDVEEPPICNGIDGKYYESIVLSYNKDGEIVIKPVSHWGRNERKSN